MPKIALIGDSLSGGGAEKVHAHLSIYFQRNGMEVHNCIFSDRISYQFEGSVLNLGKIDADGSSISRKWNRFQSLRTFILENKFDHVIDFRMRTNPLQELMISMLYPKNSIYTVHSSILEYYFPKPFIFAKRIFSKHRIVTVSEAIKQIITSEKIAHDVTCIYNPINFESILNQKEQFKVGGSYIIAVGRMNDEVKQFDKLIEAYSQTELPDRKIKLLFLGEGKNEKQLKAIAQNKGLYHLIEFHGFAANPFPYYKNALFLVLPSKKEGFPMVIAEALASETPVVAFDCVSGPNEIIAHRENGFLVENQNFPALVSAINLMVKDERLYLHCKQNASSSVQRFSLDIVGSQWLQYLKSNVS
ncbi:MAG TPA: glycosyltransferase [Flavobacterium sp.]|jgi:N-acetylgalactosamine-N,N'-diacetylbacillosaminyl-diphospho-undecaprenol 4-alpha-N-acetylgalactosaminyltransferase